MSTVNPAEAIRFMDVEAEMSGLSGYHNLWTRSACFAEQRESNERFPTFFCSAELAEGRQSRRYLGTVFFEF